MAFAAAYSVTISPKFKTTLGCNGYHDELYQAKDSELEINAVRLKQDDHETYLISIDTLFVGPNLVEDLSKEISQQLDIKKEQIQLYASHTHYAPLLDKTKPKLGSVNDDYYQFVFTSIIDVMQVLSKRELEPVSISYAESTVEDSCISRRKNVWFFRRSIVPWKAVTIFPNETNKIDDTLRLFHLKKKDGSVLAIMWSLACHPVMYHSPKHLSGHYPADVRSAIRTKQSVPVLFFQGFSGDVRPKHLLKTLNMKERLLFWLNKAYPFGPFSERSYKTWVSGISKVIESLDLKLKDIQPLALNSQSYNIPIKELCEGQLTQENIQVTALFLSKETVILSVSAEMVAAYSFMLKERFPHLTIIPVGCMGAVFGYWPTTAMLDEGGYESKGFRKFFELKGDFKAPVETIFIKAVTKVLST